MRFDYGYYRTLDRANDALETLFANGDVFLCEHPRIERHGKFFKITLQG